MARKSSSRLTEPSKSGKLESGVELYTVSDLPKTRPSLYIPNATEEQHAGLRKKLGEYWETYAPKTLFDYLTLIQSSILGGPTGYILWKMPPETHKSFNGLLSKVTEASALMGQEEIAFGTGIAYAVSQAIYGIKTRSGGHVISGLQGIVTHGKKMDTSSMNPEKRKKLSSALKTAETLLGVISKVSSIAA